MRKPNQFHEQFDNYARKAYSQCFVLIHWQGGHKALRQFIRLNHSLDPRFIRRGNQHGVNIR